MKPEPFYAVMTYPTCGKDVGQDGVFLVARYDFEGFKKEIERYGFWDDDMREAQEAVQARLVFQGAQP